MAWAVGAGAVAVVAALVALTAVGFTSAGVAAGSLAAATQSAVYGGYVASGSAFALAQSAGAAGIGVKVAVAIGTAVGGATMYMLTLKTSQAFKQIFSMVEQSQQLLFFSKLITNRRSVVLFAS